MLFEGATPDARYVVCVIEGMALYGWSAGIKLCRVEDMLLTLEG